MKLFASGKSGLVRVLVLAACVAPLPAAAQGVLTTHRLSAQLANELVGESVAQCAAKGYKVVATVVDLEGVKQAVLRGDGAPIHSMDNAYFKAYTAASMTLGRNEGSTREVAARLAKGKPSTVPFTPLPNVTYTVGGVTIKHNNMAIGAIGVSGAPGGQYDEECALAAMAKIADRMK